MVRSSRRLGLILSVYLFALVVPSLALAADEVLLSNDLAESEATYGIRFETTVKGKVDKFRITLPAGTNAAAAVLGRVYLGKKAFEGDETKHSPDLSVDLLDPNTLIMDLKDSREVKAGSAILIELFNLANPVAGSYAVDVTILDKKDNVIEVIPPIAFSTFPSGDITGVIAGTGLVGGGDSGDVTLHVNPAVVQSRVTGTCPAGSSIR